MMLSHRLPGAKPMQLACIAALSACVIGSGAVAGNLKPVEKEPVIVPPAAPTANGWQGFYGGAKLGYAFGSDDTVGHRDPGGVMVTRDAGDLGDEGMNYGLRLGWRGERQLTRRSYVYGIELGYDRGDVSESFSSGVYTASTDLNHVLGVRLKSGITSQSGQTLFYGILGYVHGDIDYAVKGTAGGDTIDLDTSYDTDGYSVGLGVEHLLSENWSVNAEWEYYNFGSKTLTDSGGSSTVATPDYNNLQVGVNFRF